MAKELTEKFIAALNEIEKNKNFDSMVELFDDSSEIGNVTQTENFKGADGALEFWQNYRAAFGDVSSTFKNEITDGNVSALEWKTEFNRPNGGDFHYHGVSIIEFEGEKIKRFFAYFDPQILGEQLIESAHGKEA